MTRKCVLCKENNYRNSYSFFSAPKNKETREKWQAAIGIKNYSVTDDTYVCSKHFHKDDIITHWVSGIPPRTIAIKYKKCRLRPGAVPRKDYNFVENPQNSDDSDEVREAMIFKTKSNLKVNNDKDNKSSLDQRFSQDFNGHNYHKTNSSKDEELPDNCKNLNDRLKVRKFFVGNSDQQCTNFKRVKEKENQQDSYTIVSPNRVSDSSLKRYNIPNDVEVILLYNNREHKQEKHITRESSDQQCVDIEHTEEQYKGDSYSNESSKKVSESSPKSYDTSIEDEILVLHDETVEEEYITLETSDEHYVDIEQRKEKQNRGDSYLNVSPKRILESSAKSYDSIEDQPLVLHDETVKEYITVEHLDEECIDTEHRKEKRTQEDSYSNVSSDRMSEFSPKSFDTSIEDEVTIMQEEYSVENLEQCNDFEYKRKKKDQNFCTNVSSKRISESSPVSYHDNSESETTLPLKIEILNKEYIIKESLEDNHHAMGNVNIKNKIVNKSGRNASYSFSETGKNEILFDTLLEVCTQMLLPCGWSCMITCKDNRKTIVYLCMDIMKTGMPFIEKQVFIRRDMELHCAVANVEIDPLSYNLIKRGKGLKVQNLTDIEELVEEFDGRNVCLGMLNAEEYHDMKCVTAAYKDGMKWRHISCPLIMKKSSRCSNCISLSRILQHKMKSSASASICTKQQITQLAWEAYKRTKRQDRYQLKTLKRYSANQLPASCARPTKKACRN